MTILRPDDTQVAVNVADASAIAVLAGYFYEALPQIALLATVVWAVLRVWLIVVDIKLRRAQLKLAKSAVPYGRRASDQTEG